MIKCIIVDDEPLAREGMRMNIEELENLELVGEFANSAEASKFLLKNKVDLMFLDVEMPGMNGIEFLRNLDNPPMVILTTAYSQYAVEAYCACKCTACEHICARFRKRQLCVCEAKKVRQYFCCFVSRWLY